MARYVITGGAGFIGSHLAEALLLGGNKVTALDNLTTGRLANLTAFAHHPDFSFVQGSVLDELVVDEAVRNSDVVVHLAAAVGVKLIVEQPLYSLTTNIKGAITVLEAAHRYRRKVMVASTSEIYGKNNWARSTKSQTASWGLRRSPGGHTRLPRPSTRSLPTRTTGNVTCRPSWCVSSTPSGPARARPMAWSCRGSSTKLSLESRSRYTGTSQTRCFCHVTDVVDALIRILNEPLAQGDVFNVGSSEEISIEELARRIVSKTESASLIVHIPYDIAYETGFEDMARRVPDTTKLETLTGWRATRSLDQILDDVISESRKETAAFAAAGDAREAQ